VTKQDNASVGFADLLTLVFARKLGKFMNTLLSLTFAALVDAGIAVICHGSGINGDASLVLGLAAGAMSGSVLRAVGQV